MSNLAPISAKEIMDKFTTDQIQLISNTVARGATTDELKLFLYRCSLLGLNPLKPGQIHFIKYGSNPGTVVVGIEGFRSAAARTGKHVSTERGIKGEGKDIHYGWCKIKRRDQSGEVQEYYEEVPFNEFYNDKNPSWKRMPETMIKKVAEAATLRMAYPDDLGGIYIQEEEQVIKDNNPEQKQPWITQPTAEEIGVSDKYIIKFGSLAGRTLEEVLRQRGVEAIKKSVELVEEKLAKNETYKNVVRADMEEYLQRATAVIVSYENGDMNQEEAP